MSEFKPFPLRTSQHRTSKMIVTGGMDGFRILVGGETGSEPICDGMDCGLTELRFPTPAAAYVAMNAASAVWSAFIDSLNRGAFR